MKAAVCEGTPMLSARLVFALGGIYSKVHSEFFMATARVLVVDDEPLLLDVYVRTLSRQGYDVRSAAGSYQALQIVASESPINVALSDVIMPGMWGTELVREIARLSPETACILMTGGVIDSAQVPRGIRLVRKPISQSDLIATVERAIARSMKRRAKLRRSIELSAQLRQESRQLRSESRETVRRCAAAREARLIRKRRRAIPP